MFNMKFICSNWTSFHKNWLRVVDTGDIGLWGWVYYLEIVTGAEITQDDALLSPCGGG
jgi:hypothetical protein